MISYPREFLFLSTSLCSLSRMGLQKHTLHAMQRTGGKRPKLAGLPPLPMRELQEYFWLSRYDPWYSLLNKRRPLITRHNPGSVFLLWMILRAKSLSTRKGVRDRDAKDAP